VSVILHIARGAVTFVIALLAALGISADFLAVQLVPVQKFLTKKIEGSK
jgi:hypothetical protein